jgi:uncharacterized protein (DUF433 family)
MDYKYIEINPGIAGGSPIFSGTRIPIYIILDFISAGNTVQEIIEHYPQLTADHIQEAIKFASDSLKYKDIFVEISA